LGWADGVLKTVARAQAGDPGRVVLRRLNNAEYTFTIRDLTGVTSLSPASEFPADGAAGEGFMNTGGALSMSPSLVTKYLDAGKGIASHAVLLPDGIRFSAMSSRRDWTNEILADIRKFYGAFTEAGGAETVTQQGIALEEMDPDDFAARRNMLEYDPPEHTRYRRLVSKPFSRREVYAYENGIRLLAREVVEEACALGDRFDYVDRIAKQLPMRMLGRLLGVPDEDGRCLVKRGGQWRATLPPGLRENPLRIDKHRAVTAIAAHALTRAMPCCWPTCSARIAPGCTPGIRAACSPVNCGPR